MIAWSLIGLAYFIYVAADERNVFLQEILDRGYSAWGGLITFAFLICWGLFLWRASKFALRNGILREKRTVALFFMGFLLFPLEIRYRQMKSGPEYLAAQKIHFLKESNTGDTGIEARWKEKRQQAIALAKKCAYSPKTAECLNE